MVLGVISDVSKKEFDRLEDFPQLTVRCRDYGKQIIFKREDRTDGSRNKKLSPDFEADGYDEDGNLIYDTAYCPICHNGFELDCYGWGCNFCPECGQALEWTEEQEDK